MKKLAKRILVAATALLLSIVIFSCEPDEKKKPVKPRKPPEHDPIEWDLGDEEPPL